MAGDEKSAAALSRALLLGATLGTIPLIQIGCTEKAGSTGWVQATASPDEADLCARALATRDPATVEELLRRYPRGSCTVPTLDAMPRETLAQISPAVLSAVPRSVRAQIPRETAIHLRLPQQRVSSSEPGGGVSS